MMFKPSKCLKNQNEKPEMMQATDLLSAEFMKGQSTGIRPVLGLSKHKFDYWNQYREITRSLIPVEFLSAMCEWSAFSIDASQLCTVPQMNPQQY